MLIGGIRADTGWEEGSAAHPPTVNAFRMDHHSSTTEEKLSLLT